MKLPLPAGRSTPLAPRALARQVASIGAQGALVISLTALLSVLVSNALGIVRPAQPAQRRHADRPARPARTPSKPATRPPSQPTEPAPELGIEGTGVGSLGVLIDGVNPEGPAARAGIELGDVITSIDGEAVESMSGLEASLASREPGEVVVVRVFRFGGELVLTVTLG